MTRCQKYSDDKIQNLVKIPYFQEYILKWTYPVSDGLCGELPNCGTLCIEKEKPCCREEINYFCEPMLDCIELNEKCNGICHSDYRFDPTRS